MRAWCYWDMDWHLSDLLTDGTWRLVTCNGIMGGKVYLGSGSIYIRCAETAEDFESIYSDD